jgi:hypothetical protein
MDIYYDYMYSSPMTDGEEIRSFFDEDEDEDEESEEQK